MREEQPRRSTTLPAGQFVRPVGMELTSEWSDSDSYIRRTGPLKLSQTVAEGTFLIDSFVVTLDRGCIFDEPRSAL